MSIEKKIPPSSSSGKAVVPAKNQQTPPPPPTSSEKSLSEQSVPEMLKQMREHHEKLQAQIENILSVTGVRDTAVEEFLKNPANFSEKEWKQIQESKVKLAAQLWKDASVHMQKEQKKQETSKTDKARKAKTGGARRNWIPMR